MSVRAATVDRFQQQVTLAAELDASVRLGLDGDYTTSPLDAQSAHAAAGGNITRAPGATVDTPHGNGRPASFTGAVGRTCNAWPADSHPSKRRPRGEVER
jgi:hypothetical protein